MMKIYKKGTNSYTWKASAFLLISPLIIVLDIKLPSIMMDAVNHGSQYVILITTIGFNILVAYSYFFCFRYVAIDYDTLYIKSTLPPFYRKEFLLNDIRKVIISTSDDNRLQIIQKNGIKYSFRTLLMKDNFMLCELANDLRAQGIEVDFPQEIEDGVARQKRSWERQRRWKERMRQKKQDNNNKTQTL